MDSDGSWLCRVRSEFVGHIGPRLRPPQRPSIGRVPAIKRCALEWRPTSAEICGGAQYSVDHLVAHLSAEVNQRLRLCGMPCAPEAYPGSIRPYGIYGS